METVILELKDGKGLIGTVEVTAEKAEELKKILGFGSVSDAKVSEAEAKLAEVEPQLKESKDRVTELEGEVATLKAPETKAAWLKEFLTPENFVVVASQLGYELPEVKAEVVEHVEGVEAEVAEPTIMKGKTDKPNWTYLPNIDMSIKDKKEGE